MQFPLINFREPVTKRDRTHMEVATSFSVLIGESEIEEIRKRLATGNYSEVTEIEACWNGQVRRRYRVKDGKILDGVHFTALDYTCSFPLALRIPKED